VSPNTLDLHLSKYKTRKHRQVVKRVKKGLLHVAGKESTGVISIAMIFPKERKHGDFIQGAYTYSCRKAH
jgi:hypothetical protein